MTNTNIQELEKNLIQLYKKKFNILIEKNNGTQFKKHHVLRKIKYNIAKTLTKLTKLKRDKLK